MDPKFDEKGLVVAIAQDAYTGQVLMQAFMNREAYDLTLSTRRAHYYSRSRKALWQKGETSGHFQDVVSVALDCDGDCVLLRVKQTGAACHTGAYSCFFNGVRDFERIPNAEIIYRDRATIFDRIASPQEGSYTNYLWEKGTEKICKKIAEESGEIIIAAIKDDPDELKCEIADLAFHIQVLMAKTNLSLEDVFGVLEARAGAERPRNWKN